MADRAGSSQRSRVAEVHHRLRDAVEAQGSHQKGKILSHAATAPVRSRIRTDYRAAAGECQLSCPRNFSCRRRQTGNRRKRRRADFQRPKFPSCAGQSQTGPCGLSSSPASLAFSCAFLKSSSRRSFRCDSRCLAASKLRPARTWTSRCSEGWRPVSPRGSAPAVPAQCGPPPCAGARQS